MSRSFRLLFRLMPIFCTFLFHSFPVSFNRIMNFMVDAKLIESKELMNGKVLRVVVIHYPPAIVHSKTPDGGDIYTGSEIDIFDYIGSALNVRFEYILVKEDAISKYGIGPAQFNLVINGEADILAWGLVLSHAKFLALDVSTPVMIEPFQLMVPWPKEQSRLLAPILPFQFPVWICLGISLVVLAPILAFISGFYLRYFQNQIVKRPILDFAGILYNFSFLLSHITNQGYRYDLRLRSRGSYILVGIWCLMAVVLANAYGGVLFSFLSVAKLEPALNSLEEVAHSKIVKFSVIDRSELAFRLLSATSGYEKLIGDSLREHPDRMISRLSQIKAKMMTGTFAFPYIKMYTNNIIDATYRENGNKCVATYAKEPIPQFSPVVQILAKNGPYTKAINEQIQAQIEAGLIDFYMKRLTPTIDQCLLEKQQASAHVKSLALVDMSSAFVVLAFGLSFASLVFLLELVYKSMIKHYFKK